MISPWKSGCGNPSTMSCTGPMAMEVSDHYDGRPGRHWLDVPGGRHAERRACGYPSPRPRGMTASADGSEDGGPVVPHADHRPVLPRRPVQGLLRPAGVGELAGRVVVTDEQPQE